MLRPRTGGARLAPALVTIAAALVASAPAAAAPPMRLINRPVASAAATTATRPLTIFGGSTSRDDPFALEVSKDHKRLVRVLLHAVARCPDGSIVTESGAVPFQGSEGTGGQNRFYANTLARRGRFRSKGLGVEDYGSEYGQVSETLTGRISGTRASGTLSVTVQVLETNTGRFLTSCTTGPLTWKAKAVPGKVYAGLTAQRRPVVVELSPDRLRVDHLRLGWATPCQPEGYFSVGDHFGNFFVGSAGDFGNAFDAGPYPTSDGGNSQFHYDVHGRVGHTSASGTFAVTLTHTAADGTVDGTCALAAERWKATS